MKVVIVLLVNKISRVERGSSMHLKPLFCGRVSM